MILSGSAGETNKSKPERQIDVLIGEVALEQEAAEPRDGITPRPEVILTTEEESKAQKALAARNRGREQNKLRMRRVKEAQRAAKEAGKVSSPAG